MMKMKLLIGALGTLLACQTYAQSTVAKATETWSSVDTVTANLQKRYPATPFSDIKESKIPGLFQVTMGKNIGYVEPNGRYFLFGKMFDMQTQTDLTEQPKADASKVEFTKLPFANALKIKKGNGKRVFAVFSDPDCPYCKQMESTLSRMTDYTEYVFLMPLASLHPDATAHANAIWCSKNRIEAYQNWILDGVVPKGESECKTPVDDNIALGEKMGIAGTPTLISSKGVVGAGAMPRAEFDIWLNPPAEEK